MKTKRDCSHLSLRKFIVSQSPNKGKGEHNGRETRKRDFRLQLQPNSFQTAICGLFRHKLAKEKYVVDADAKQCTCPDFESRQATCKHIFAVEYTIRREYTDDGQTQTVTETVTVKKTYKQEWPAYNAAQVNEKDQFQKLLHDLCKGVGEPSQKMGRPRLPFEDMIFSACFKVYSTVSGRRFMSDLRDAKAKGHISQAPLLQLNFQLL